MTVFWPMDFLVFLTYNVVLGERGANRSDHRPGEERETNRENVRGEGGKDLFFFLPHLFCFHPDMRFEHSWEGCGGLVTA